MTRLARFAICAMLGIAPAAQAQLPGLGNLASAFRVDLSIPDAPAFKLLDVDASTILRPGNLTEANAILSRFQAEDGGLQLPEAIAIEVSPALLASGPRLERASYEQKRLLYNTRLSAAVSPTEDGVGRHLAFGVRLGLVNEADLRLDADFMNEPELQVTPLLTRANQIQSAALERLGPPVPGAPRVPAYSVEEQAELDEIAETIRERWAERHWNARAFDVAIGVRATTIDDQGSDPEVTAVGAWLTFAQPVSDWGQLLAGGRLGGVRDTADGEFEQTVGLAARLYVGGNVIKAFAEVQDEIAEGAGADLLFSMGADFRIAEWIWGTASLGFATRDDESESIRTTLKLKTALPKF